MLLVLTLGCPAACALTLPDCIETVEEEAFYGVGVQAVIVPESVTEIGDSAFAGMPNLAKLTIRGLNISLGLNALGIKGSDIIIAGYTNSTAYTYASNYGISFWDLAEDSDVMQVLKWADSKLGTEYVSGKTDCVMLVYYAYKSVGITLPARCQAMYNLSSAKLIPKPDADREEARVYDKTEFEAFVDSLLPGDVLCWHEYVSDSSKEPDTTVCTHVGIYVGATKVNGVQHKRGDFIESSSSAGKVRYWNIYNTGYHQYALMGARRVIK